MNSFGMCWGPIAVIVIEATSKRKSLVNCDSKDSEDKTTPIFFGCSMEAMDGYGPFSAMIYPLNWWISMANC